MLHETYWIIRAKNAVKRLFNKCVFVRYKKWGTCHVITPSRTFKHTGVDYTGPFSIKILRNKSGKNYLCLFVYMATKAIHLELVSDLTKMFLNVLKRFVSRRGKCDSILSDNGKNFFEARNLAANRGISVTSRKSSKNYWLCVQSRYLVEIHFTTFPHIGDLWEANVKSVKTHLKAVINDTLLSFEELYIVLSQIEAILNSRPLSNTPDKLDILTPGIF